MCIDEICDPRATRMLVDTDGILNNHGREIPSLFGGGQSVLISALPTEQSVFFSLLSSRLMCANSVLTCRSLR